MISLIEQFIPLKTEPEAFLQGLMSEEETE